MRSPVIPLELRRQTRQFLRDHLAAIVAATEIDKDKLLARGLPARCLRERLTLKLVGGESMSCPRALVVHDGDLRLVLTPASGYFVFHAATIAALEVEPAMDRQPPEEAAPARRRAPKRRKPRIRPVHVGNVVAFVRPRKGR